MLPTLAGVEPATSWSPAGRRIQLSHQAGRKGLNSWFTSINNMLKLLNISVTTEMLIDLSAKSFKKYYEKC